MIHRSSEEQIKDYYERYGVNQSSIKVLIHEGIEGFLAKRDQLLTSGELYYEEKEYFIIGSAVDTFITSGKDVYESKYFSSRLAKKPPEKPMSIVKMVFDSAIENLKGDVTKLGTLDLNTYKRVLYEACDLNQYYLNRRIPKDANDTRTWEEDKRAENMLKDGLCQLYWEELKTAIGKQILSDEESTIINNIIMTWTTHKFTGRLFVDSENVDIVYQLPIYFELDNIDCKALLDMIIINHELKRIMPIDLKTFRDYILKFNRQISLRRYDLQAAFYTKALSLFLRELSDILGRDVTNYEISNFAFITASTLKPSIPLIYVLQDCVLEEGRIGNGVDKLGYEQGLSIYNDWNALNFSVEEKYSSTNGVIWLDTDYRLNL